MRLGLLIAGLEGTRRLLGYAVYRPDGRLVAAGKAAAEFADKLETLTKAAAGRPDEHGETIRAAGTQQAARRCRGPHSSEPELASAGAPPPTSTSRAGAECARNLAPDDSWKQLADLRSDLPAHHLGEIPTAGHAPGGTTPSSPGPAGNSACPRLLPPVVERQSAHAEAFPDLGSRELLPLGRLEDPRSLRIGVPTTLSRWCLGRLFPGLARLALLHGHVPSPVSVWSQKGA